MSTRNGSGARDLRERPWKLAVTGDYATVGGSTIYGDIGLGALAEYGIEWSLVEPHEDGLRGADLEGFDALWLLGSLAFGEKQLRETTTLEHVARFGAGYDQVDLDACDRHGVTVTNAPTGLRVPMAHSAIALLFALAHNVLPKDHLVRTAQWERKSEYRGQGLVSATIGVIGLGGIGQQTTRLLRGLGLDVLAWNRSPRPEFCAEIGIEQGDLDEVLRRSDHVIVTVAANTQTRHLIGARELQLMKSSAFVINIARGAIIDEEALVTALEDGAIAGAGLDVFETEPLPADSPLIDMENVVLAPHSLCWTQDFTDDTAAEARSEIIAIAEGRAANNVVNAPRTDHAEGQHR